MRFIQYRVLIALAVFVLFVASGEACAPGFTGLVFTRPHGPDGPISAFTGGRIGVPLEGWWRAYLVVAYRYLEEKPLTVAEARSFRQFWDENTTHGVALDPPEQAIQRWLKERSQYSKTPPADFSAFRAHGDYSSFDNCLAPAFRTAAETLRSRAHQLGPGSPELQEWIHGQDSVFGNCHGNAALPAVLPAGANPLLRADRAYQIAAANFYKTKYDVAMAEFDAIGKDSASPWREIAPYLSIRALLRKGRSTNEFNDSYDEKVLAELQKRLSALLQDPTRAAFHRDARLLQNLIAYRQEPLLQQHRLAARLVRLGEGDAFGQELRDYTLLLDKYLDDQPDFPDTQRYEKEYEEKLHGWRNQQYLVRRQERADELTDWLTTFQSDSPAAVRHAVTRWRTTRTTPWLFAAMSKLNGPDVVVPEVIGAAAEIGPGVPAYAAITYHRARLLRERGEVNDARQVVREALASRDRFPLSTINLFEDEQMRVADEFGEFAGLLARRPVEATMDGFIPDLAPGCFSHKCEAALYGKQNPGRNSPLLRQFDPTVATILNTRVPLTELGRIVNSRVLPENLQTNIAPAIWLRAALLDNQEVAAEVSDAAIAARPELGPYSGAFAKADTPAERKFSAAFAAAHFPGLRPFVDSTFPRQTPFTRIDNYRDNWWCADLGADTYLTSYDKQWMDGKEKERLHRPPSPVPAYLSATQVQAADSERLALLRMGAAGISLPKILIEWARSHPRDPRAPEALHHVVRISHYACSDPNGDRPVATKAGRQAFKLLHKNYPHSEWAEKTPYWY